MASPNSPDIAAGRLDSATLKDNFSDLHSPLTAHEAKVEADRCYFCYDAPCMGACPTAIDIPLFIRQISTGSAKGAAETILSQNIMGGMCARVCPTETLCEEVCVREASEGQPVKIGQLQRYATDALMALGGAHPFARAASTGKRVAIVGAGPAGLACAHRTSMYGHDVTVFEARSKPGGLNEFGIASYKSTEDFAAKEVDFILGIGGIEIAYDRVLGRDITLNGLSSEFDAVFLAIGLGQSRTLGLAEEEPDGSDEATAFISDLRQSSDLSQMPVGRNIVVIGGGMTAIDIATQAKLLGAETVTICYRRGPQDMNASAYEQELAQTTGVSIRHWVQPLSIATENGQVTGITFAYSARDGSLTQTRETLHLPADQVFRAIGQSLAPEPLGGTDIAFENGRIAVDEHHRTSLPGIWAGGDCIAGDQDLTVVAVEHGKRAAEDIHAHLSGKET